MVPRNNAGKNDISNGKTFFFKKTENLELGNALTKIRTHGIHQHM